MQFQTGVDNAGAVRNKKRHEHSLPLNEPAYSGLVAWRKRRGIVGEGWVFPSLSDPKEPLTKWVASAWLRRAEKLAELPHLDGGTWHTFRRGWATARKHLPLKDVAAGGGWTDTQTVLRCYTHADAEATRAAATYVA